MTVQFPKGVVQAILHLNAHSVARRPATICAAVCDEKLDLLLLTETWHECSDSVVLKNVTPSGYKYLDAPHPLPSDTNFQTLNVLELWRIALIHLSSITVLQRQLGISLTTFELSPVASSRLPKRISCYWESTDLEVSESPQRSLTNYCVG